jgi:hypothetical protein
MNQTIPSHAKLEPSIIESDSVLESRRNISILTPINQNMYEQTEVPSNSFCPFHCADGDFWHFTLSPGYEGQYPWQNRIVVRFYLADPFGSVYVF